MLIIEMLLFVYIYSIFKEEIKYKIVIVVILVN